MTQETRETLEQMYAYATARAEWTPSLLGITDTGWDGCLLGWQAREGEGGGK